MIMSIYNPRHDKHPQCPVFPAPCARVRVRALVCVACVRAYREIFTATTRDVERSSMLEKEGPGGGGSGGDKEAPAAAAAAPKVDLSLKQGEKIKISIGGGSKVTTRVIASVGD